ncbi:MAG: hypothetical protein HW388_1349 [Dehalococcoidia bacterium]|nr:hypothetical protein [Dehalococcoidia bacterium]
MRRLLYVPIIHEEIDLGSLGEALAQESAALSGSDRWARHKETLRAFWESVAAYLGSFDPRLLRLYQDGMVAEGEMGMRIVQEGARRGSRNYQLILELLSRGAELRKTEDPLLLLAEHAHLVGRSPGVVSSRERDSLMEERDAFIAGAINGTLQEGEVGVLFIGAGHGVLPHLDGDVSVHGVKDPEKLRMYMQELLLGAEPRKLAALARYVAAPVPLP